MNHDMTDRKRGRWSQSKLSSTLLAAYSACIPHADWDFGQRTLKKRGQAHPTVLKELEQRGNGFERAPRKSNLWVQMRLGGRAESGERFRVWVIRGSEGVRLQFRAAAAADATDGDDDERVGGGGGSRGKNCQEVGMHAASV